MRRSSGPRKTANLSESIHQQLNMYAIAAGAAGVGVLALGQPVEAKIVYTPADTQLPVNAPLYLDLNHDGVKDFEFYLRSASRPPTGSRSIYNSLRVTGQRKNEVWTVRSSYTSRFCAAALPKGRQMGPRSPFQKGSHIMAVYAQSVGGGGTAFCPWASNNVNTHPYLGLKFLINGKFHFGWARIENVTLQRVSATLVDYAYETIPNKPIVAGKTKGPDAKGDIKQPSAFLAPHTPKSPTLGLLALGSPGLSIWRRKESLDARQ
jgi:hypothetical protein